MPSPALACSRLISPALACSRLLSPALASHVAHGPTRAWGRHLLDWVWGRRCERRPTAGRRGASQAGRQAAAIAADASAADRRAAAAPHAFAPAHVQPQRQPTLVQGPRALAARRQSEAIRSVKKRQSAAIRGYQPALVRRERPRAPGDQRQSGAISPRACSKTSRSEDDEL